MSRAQLNDIVEENIEFSRTGTIRQAEQIGRVPVEHYFDAERWQRECDLVFRRLPLGQDIGSDSAQEQGEQANKGRNFLIHGFLAYCALALIVALLPVAILT